MPTYNDRIGGTIRWVLKDFMSATVTMYQEDYEHIVEHHPIMHQNEQAIKKTVQEPDSVYRDKEYDNRRVYYKSVSATTYASKVPITAVVLEGADSTWTDARVVSAFPRKKEGGADNDIIYTRDKD